MTSSMAPIIVGGVVLLILTLLGRVLGSIVGKEVTGWLPYVSSALVTRAVRKLPPNERERWNREWAADIAQFENRPLTQLTHALWTTMSARALSRELGAGATQDRATWRDRMIGATWRVPLVFLDIAGITLGVFAALVLRELYRGHGLHGADVWRRIESPTLPYVMLAMVLVFSYAGMYRSRELRGRGGRLASSSLVVGLLALAASVGTGQGLGEVAIVPSALAFSAALVTLMRWSYQTITDDVLRLARKRGVVMTGLQESERGDNS